MADRSVSVELRAKVAGFIAGMGAAKRETVDLGRKMTETGAHADSFRRRLENATKALPKIEIDADSTPAEIEFAKLRAQMERLTEKRIGIDIDAGAARAELAQIERDLSRLQRGNANIAVNADISTALAELRAVDGEISKVDGRTAKVNVTADVAGALAGIATVSVALAALPAALTIGVGVAGLGAAFAAAGAGAGGFAAVAVPGLTRVNEALKQTASAAGGGGAGGAMKSAAQSAADAAAKALRLAEAQDRVKDSAAAVKKAQQGVKDALRDVRDSQDALRQSQEAAGVAAARVGEVSAAGSRRIVDAERSAAEAHRATQRAVEDLTRARERAQERLEDLALATEGGALAEERAQLSIRRAQQNLTRVTQPGSGASQTDKDEAELALREAEFNLKRLRESNADLAAEAKKANEQGVEGSDEVRAAKEALEAATRREADAERAVGDARTQAARDVAAAQRDAAAAAQEVARSQRDVGDAQRKVAEANAAVIKSQRDQLRATQRLKLEQLQAKAAMEQAGAAAGGSGGAASKMAELSKAERALAKDVKAFSDEYLTWQRELQPDVFPAISQGMDLIVVGLHKIGPGVSGAGKALTTLGQDAEKSLRGPFWTDFFNDINTEIPGALTRLGHTGGNVLEGFAGTIQALLPYGRDLLGNVEDISEGFAKWGKGLGSDSNFRSFMAEVQRNGPQIWQTLKDVATTGGHVVEALAPFGVGSLSGLSLLAKLTAGMSPEHIQGIALAVGAVYVAVNTGKGINAAVDALGRLRDRMNDVGTAAGTGKTGIGGKLGGLAGMLGAGGPWGLAVGAGALVLGEFALANQEAAGKVRDLASALGESQGAMSKAFKEKIGQGLIDSGAAEAARKLGINLETLRSAALGNKDAIAQVNAQLNQHRVNLDGVIGKGAAFAYGTRGLTQDAYAVKSALDGTNTTIADARKQYAETALVNADLQGSYEDVKRALDAAGGSMDTTKGKTASQREATELARQKFDEFAKKVAETANAQGILTGKTDDARKAFEDQIPKLFELAGKSKTAREQVYELAQKFGISRDQADKAAKKINDVKEAAAKLKSPPPMKITADTSQAEAKIVGLLRKYGLATAALPEGVAAPKAKPKLGAYGGVWNADGREYMAQGGIRSAGSSPQAMIATSPYMISGRSGPDVIYGEAGWEAFIPLDSSKRGRGLQILNEAAGIMGMAVVPQQVAAASSAPAWTGGSLSGASGQATVTVTGISDLKSSLDATSSSLTSSLTAATDGLTSTLGDAGSVTSALQQMTDTLGTQLTALTSAIEGLSGAVAGAGAVASAAEGQIGTAAAAKAKAKSATGKIGTAISATATKSKTAKGIGSAGTSLAGLVGIDNALAAAAKKAAAQKIQINMVGGSSSVSAPVQGVVNPSKVSKPVQSSPKVVTMVAGSNSGDYVGPSSGTSGSTSPLVHIDSMQVREQADIDMVAAKISMRVDGRG
ncbi:hypothetical protein AB0395_41200 [Streptosporangium sp. NPDC051023]|uniref:hypothetical protein n=1 Tax=Streptosporangium sp. NPDC051023 TaxID=3155410 RepID=UPI003450B89A